MIWLILVTIGFLGGTLGSLMGLGGGIIVVPSLLFLGSLSLLDMTPQVAVGSSLVIMIVTGISATLAYMKQKKVDYKSGLLFFSASGPGAIVGTWFNQWFHADSFQLYLGMFILLVSFFLFMRNRFTPKPYTKKSIERTYINPEGNTLIYGFNVIPALLLAFVVGMLSGLFGIGGGSLMVPAMILLFHFPPHIAVATSMFMILLSAFVGSVSHIVLGNVQWLYILALLPGAWVGGLTGASINRRLSSDRVVFVLRIVLIVVALRLVLKGVS